MKKELSSTEISLIIRALLEMEYHHRNSKQSITNHLNKIAIKLERTEPTKLEELYIDNHKHQKIGRKPQRSK